VIGVQQMESQTMMTSERAGVPDFYPRTPARTQTTTPGAGVSALAAGGLPIDKVAHRPTDVQGALDRISLAVQRAVLRVECSKGSDSEAVSGKLTATRGGEVRHAGGSKRPTP